MPLSPLPLNALLFLLIRSNPALFSGRSPLLTHAAAATHSAAASQVWPVPALESSSSSSSSMPAVPSEIEELNALNKRLLQAITDGDWETYKQLCDPSLTCFEPESKGYLVEGLDFHKYYFNLTAAKKTTSVGKEVDASAPAKVTVTNLKASRRGALGSCMAVCDVPVCFFGWVSRFVCWATRQPW